MKLISSLSPVLDKGVAFSDGYMCYNFEKKKPLDLKRIVLYFASFKSQKVKFKNYDLWQDSRKHCQECFGISALRNLILFYITRIKYRKK